MDVPLKARDRLHDARGLDFVAELGVEQEVGGQEIGCLAGVQLRKLALEPHAGGRQHGVPPLHRHRGIQLVDRGFELLVRTGGSEQLPQAGRVQGKRIGLRRVRMGEGPHQLD